MASLSAGHGREEGHWVIVLKSCFKRGFEAVNKDAFKSIGGDVQAVHESLYRCAVIKKNKGGRVLGVGRQKPGKVIKKFYFNIHRKHLSRRTYSGSHGAESCAYTFRGMCLLHNPAEELLRPASARHICQCTLSSYCFNGLSSKNYQSCTRLIYGKYLIFKIKTVKKKSFTRIKFLSLLSKMAVL